MPWGVNPTLRFSVSLGEQAGGLWVRPGLNIRRSRCTTGTWVMRDLG